MDLNWNDISDEMRKPYRAYAFRADGHLVVLESFVAQMRVYIAVVVDGSLPKAESRRLVDDPKDLDPVLVKFCRRRVMSARPIGRKKMASAGKKVYWLEPFWPSATAVVNHLRRHSTQIERLTIEAALAELRAAPATQDTEAPAHA